MPVFGIGELNTLLADMGVPVTYGSTTVNGLLDRDADAFETTPAGLQVSVHRTIVRVKTGALTGLAVNSAITVDGNQYHIRDFYQDADGAFTTIGLVLG